MLQPLRRRRIRNLYRRINGHTQQEFRQYFFVSRITCCDFSFDGANDSRRVQRDDVCLSQRRHQTGENEGGDRACEEGGGHVKTCHCTKAANHKEKDAQIRQLEIELDTLNDAYNAQINAIIREITADDMSITADAVEAVKSENQTYFQLKEVDPSVLTLEDYRRDPILRVLVIAQIQKQNYGFFEKNDNLYKPKIKALENKIKTLKSA